MTDIKEVLVQSFMYFLIRSLKLVLLEVRLCQTTEYICQYAKATQQLAEELHKPIIGKFEKRKVYSSFKDNIWGADLADMQLICKFNKGICFLLCVIDIYSKYGKY